MIESKPPTPAPLKRLDNILNPSFQYPMRYEKERLACSPLLTNLSELNTTILKINTDENNVKKRILANNFFFKPG